MTYLVIVDTTSDNKIAKYQSYPTRAEADAHVARVAGNYPNAFVIDNPPAYSVNYTTVDTVAKTISYDQTTHDTDKTMEVWLNSMNESDNSLIPRWMEDHIELEHSGVAESPALQKRYDDKVALRATKPKE